MEKTLSLLGKNDFVNYKDFYLTSKGRARLTTMLRPDLRDKLALIADSKGISLADVLETIICEYFEIDLRPQEEWLSVEDSAKAISASVSTVRRLLPALRSSSPNSVKTTGRMGKIIIKLDALIAVQNIADRESNYLPSMPDADPEDNSKSGFVYLISDGSLFKIGYSINPIGRLSQLKTGNASAELVDYFPASKNDEKKLHKYFIAKKANLEWFRLSIEDVEKIKEYFAGKGYIYASVNSQKELF